MPLENITGGSSGTTANQRQGEFSRGSIFNPEMPEDTQYLLFLFRPSPIKAEMQAVYEKMSPIGMSHQYQSYSHTNNAVVQFDLYMNQLMLIKEGITGSENQRERSGNTENGRTNKQGASAAIEWAKRYLESLLVPPVNYTGEIGAEPPAVILSLPGVVSMRCRLMGLQTEVMEVDLENNIQEIRARVRFEEAPLARITMQDVIENGFNRTWGVGGGSY